MLARLSIGFGGIREGVVGAIHDRVLAEHGGHTGDFEGCDDVSGGYTIGYGGGLRWRDGDVSMVMLLRYCLWS